MSKLKLYDVQWLTRKGGEQLYAMQVEAHSINEAREIAREWWEESHTAHQFHLVARPAQDEFSWIYSYGERLQMEGKRLKKPLTYFKTKIREV